MTEQETHDRHVRVSFVTIVVISVLILASFSWLLNDIRNLSHRTANLSKATAHLAVENTKRINEIQNSRVYSCKANYRAIPEVLRPFFPKKLTRSQKKNLVKLHHIVNHLAKGCEKQTRPIG